ncbi:MAG: RNA-binding S4 domain-containing protein [Solobacterium sp.]|jgi:ribosomal 50S subunit-recycling heat shock protein|nr:RNA-binding S4 domain-containing protein [Solobacterium sp.]MBR2670338.1 RNA-binding S4 domain-containing protein [Solobacterium sp.]
MRIDKYLKAAHILKRRTISKELAENQRVEINGKVVKPAHEVKAGDEVKITFGRRYLVIRVLSTEEVKKKKDAVTMYEVIGEGYLEPDTE